MTFEGPSGRTSGERNVGKVARWIVGENGGGAAATRRACGDLTGRSGGVPDAADRYRTIVALSNAAGSYRTPKYHCSRPGGCWIARSGRGNTGRQWGFASNGQVPAPIRFVAFGCDRSLRRGPVSSRPGLRPRRGMGNYQITQTYFLAAAVVCLGASASRSCQVRALRPRARVVAKKLVPLLVAVLSRQGGSPKEGRSRSTICSAL